jgi:hypothetical protein
MIGLCLFIALVLHFIFTTTCTQNHFAVHFRSKQGSGSALICSHIPLNPAFESSV